MSASEPSDHRPLGDAFDRGSFAVAVVVLAIPAVLVSVIVFAVLPTPWWLGVLVGLIVAAALVWYRLRTADRAVLSKLGGGLLQPDGAASLENLVASLSLAGGVEEPATVVLSDTARNAMAVRAADRNTVVVTQGLLQSLEVVELEGVVAELLTRLRSGDAEAATAGAALFSLPILDGPAGPILGPIASFGLGRLLPADRDIEADRQAVSLTRYPPGLLNALKAMGATEGAPKANTPGLAHMWLIDPDRSGSARAETSRAPLDLRIDVLAEL